MNVRFSASRSVVLWALLGLLAASPVLASQKYPEMTTDGLKLVPTKGLDAMYWQDGARMGQYTKVMIKGCDVSFRKNWQRDQNINRSGASNQVTAEDMDRIRTGICKEFHRIFTKELQDKGGYQAVSKPGEDVIELRPSIVNLDITAPDISMHQPGIVRTYTTTAGEMTLKLDLYDSATDSVIGRAIDRTHAMRDGNLQYTNQITNRVETDRILSQWATILRKAMDAAKSANP